MLWESADPTEALRSRFGFADFGAGVEWLGGILADRWGLTIRGCFRIAISDQNAIAWVDVAESPHRVICKWSRDESRFGKLRGTTELVAALGERGVPVAVPLDGWGTEGRAETRVVAAGPAGPFSLCVLPEVDGGPLDVGDALAVRNAGAALARLHGALQEFSDSPARAVAGTPQLDLGVRVEAWMDSPAGAGAEQGQLRAALLRGLPTLPPLDAAPQLVHNDYRAANLVTEGSTIRAILDFDELAWDYCVSDLAHAGVFLATLFRDWGPTAPKARRLLLAGYETVRPLGESERAWFGFLTRCYGLAAGWPSVTL